jgi:hypothetical protein
MLIASLLRMDRHAQCAMGRGVPQDQRDRSSPHQVVSVIGPLPALSIAPLQHHGADRLDPAASWPSRRSTPGGGGAGRAYRHRDGCWRSLGVTLASR